MIQIVKFTIFIALENKIWTVKIPKILAEYHALPVIRSCKNIDSF